MRKIFISPIVWRAEQSVFVFKLRAEHAEQQVFSERRRSRAQDNTEAVHLCAAQYAPRHKVVCVGNPYKRQAATRSAPQSSNAQRRPSNWIHFHFRACDSRRQSRGTCCAARRTLVPSFYYRARRQDQDQEEREAAGLVGGRRRRRGRRARKWPARECRSPLAVSPAANSTKSSASDRLIARRRRRFMAAGRVRARLPAARPPQLFCMTVERRNGAHNANQVGRSGNKLKISQSRRAAKEEDAAEEQQARKETLELLFLPGAS